MIPERLFRRFSILNIFYWALSILIGSVLAITYFARFSRFIPFETFIYFFAILASLCAYVALTRMILPAWRRCSAFTRRAITGASVGLATTIVLLTTSAVPRGLSWQVGAAPHTDQPATPLAVQSWGSSEQQAIELHASENPNDAEPNTTFGIWRFTADVSNLSLPERQLRFFITQPDWAIINQQTGQPYQDSDGVTVLFKVEHSHEWQTLQQLVLNPLSQPDDRHWRTVDVSVPPGSEQLAVEVQPGGNNAHDRVWITTGVPQTLPNAVVQPAVWLSIAFLTCLALVSIALGLQTRPGSYIETYVQNIMGPYGGALAGLWCLLLGYMLVWRRGMYLDDYSVRFAAFDQAGHWKSLLDQSSNTLYPARLLTWEVTPRIAALLTEHELFVRSLVALFVGLNALLLGWLIYRAMGSRLAAIVGGWLFLMPVFTSATVWVGASTYVFSVTAALLFLHMFWSSLIRPQHPWLWISGSIVALCIMLLFGEAHLSVILIAGLFGIIWIAKKPGDFWGRFRRVAFLLIWPLLTFGVLYVVVFRNPKVIETRGGIATNPAVIFDRAYGFLYEFYYWSLAPGWGQQTTEGFFNVGLATIGRSLQGSLLAGIAVLLVVLVILTWRSKPLEYEASHTIGLLAIAAGVVWFVVAMAIPLALAQYSIYYESRFAYFPLAGIAVLVAASLWSIAKLLRREAYEKMLVGLSGIILIIATISTVGLTQAFAARNALDKEQIEALRRAIPAQYLPNSPIFVAVNIDEQLPGDAATLPVFGTGVLEAPWAGCPELRAAYQRDDIIVFSTNRWVPLKFSYTRNTTNVENTENLVGCPNRSGTKKITFPMLGTGMVLLINNTYIPLDKAVLFTYQKGKATAIESLSVKQADGIERLIPLPVGKTLQTNGISTITRFPVTNQ